MAEVSGFRVGGKRFFSLSLLAKCCFSERATAHHAMTWVRGSDVWLRRARSLLLPLGCGSFRLGS